MKTYSTGELAKACKVSVRTVQYYDKEGIVVPSQLSVGGRRIYSEDDFKKFHCVCLYKSLGFSLEDIKKIMETEDTYDLLLEVIMKQQEKISDEIHTLEKTKEKLNMVKEEIDNTGTLRLESLDEMEALLDKKRKHRKTDIMTYIFMGCYVLILFVGFPITVSVGGIYPFVMLIIAITLLLGLIFYHSGVNAYICPSCHEKFPIGFFKDMFTLNGGSKGKYLKCSHCGHRGWMKESFPE
ncbi:MerR family transcriptional regulator [[Clostridium] fimetarium]|uniref:DNA-binding transcriptional regulator, MerR family n=1 Tax=[Clostridium] fimetarium TaxID=99656 RepID=A0A1I0QIH9_9FIRM|nr:MerR family transcriptional regulator [[Clostridium] fimetarium]SEW26702.1 DNA-binding transcriptional regulator, MerR family [[Clostridium] fimetarium]